MGSLQLWTSVGSIISDTMQNFVLSSFLAVATSASVLHAPSGLATWPSVGGYGYASTCYGCHGYSIGKRSADPSYIGAAVTLENRNNVHGHEVASGYAIIQPHPGFAGSFQSRTQLHSGYGKRSADPSYGATLTLQNHNNLFGHQLSSGYGISQAHPGFSGSSQHVSRIHPGLLLPYSSGYGKRSADASVLFAPSGLATWPSTGGYGYGSTCYGCHGYSIGKRSADASYGATLTLQNHNNQFGHQLSSGYGISQAHPGFSGSTQQVSRLHSGHRYGLYGYFH